jgi:hypothetical protein
LKPLILEINEGYEQEMRELRESELASVAGGSQVPVCRLWTGESTVTQNGDGEPGQYHCDG